MKSKLWSVVGVFLLWSVVLSVAEPWSDTLWRPAVGAFVACCVVAAWIAIAAQLEGRRGEDHLPTVLSAEALVALLLGAVVARPQEISLAVAMGAAMAGLAGVLGWFALLGFRARDES